MTDFIFGIIQLEEEEAAFSGVDFFVEVATKDFFDKHGHMQDDYDEPVYDELIAVMDKHKMHESSESSFESETYTIEEITAKLNAEPNFSFSQKFQDFLDR